MPLTNRARGPVFPVNYGTCFSPSKNRGAVTNCTDQEDEVIMTFIISLLCLMSSETISIQREQL